MWIAIAVLIVVVLLLCLVCRAGMELVRGDAHASAGWSDYWTRLMAKKLRSAIAAKVTAPPDV